MLACVGTPSECHPVSNGFLFTQVILQNHFAGNVMESLSVISIQHGLSEHI